MNHSLKCTWILLLLCQAVTAQHQRQAHVHVLEKDTRPSNGRSISTQYSGSEITCMGLCFGDASCSSFVIRQGEADTVSCELRDQSSVTETLLERDYTARYFTKKECVSSPCLHGATCTEGLDGHTCQCAAGYTGPNCQTALRDCSEVQAAAPSTPTGVYNVAPIGGNPIQVYCDMDTDGGGWLVFQKRHNGSTNFYRTWEPFAVGFGDPAGEFWLGNRNLHRLTQQKTYTLRVVLGDWQGNEAYAQYSNFTITSELDNFRLTLSNYSGDAGDGLWYNSGMQFSTRDQDNDMGSTHCARNKAGAWWHNKCSGSNLNGRYYIGGPYTSRTGATNGVIWFHWKGWQYSYKTTKMMIRPAT